jgi:hypothetical protein
MERVFEKGNHRLGKRNSCSLLFFEHLKERVRSRPTHDSPYFNYVQEATDRTRNHSAANVATYSFLELIQLRSNQEAVVQLSSPQSINLRPRTCFHPQRPRQQNQAHRHRAVPP